MSDKRHAMPEPRDAVEVRLLAYMTAEGMSPETVRQRLYLLRGLGKHPAEVTADDVIGVLNARDLSQHSRAAYVTVYRALFADLQRLGIVDRDPMVMIKTPRTARRRPRPLSDQQLAALESLPLGSREYAWTVLGAYAGMRVGEVCSITGQALQWRSQGPVLRVTGKGGLTADIPAHPKVIAVLEPFDGQAKAIWPMWPQSMNRAWQKAAASVGLHGVVFHQLRHTFATRLTRSGVDLLVIADVCRHASVATTQRYAAVADDAPFAAVAGL